MPRRDSADQIISSLEQLNGPVSEEEKAEIDLHQKGRALAQVVNFYGWEVALEMIQSYVTGSVSALVNLAPGDPTVPTAHAAASAMNDFYIKFVQDVQIAIEASSKTPEVLKRSIKIVSAAPLESL